MTIYGAPPQLVTTIDSPWQKLANLAARDQVHQKQAKLCKWNYQTFRGRTSLVDKQCLVQIGWQFFRHQRSAHSGLRTTCPICSRMLAFSRSSFHPIQLDHPKIFTESLARWRMRESLPPQPRRSMITPDACVSVSAKYLIVKTGITACSANIPGPHHPRICRTSPIAHTHDYTHSIRSKLLLKMSYSRHIPYLSLLLQPCFPQGHCSSSRSLTVDPARGHYFLAGGPQHLWYSIAKAPLLVQTLLWVSQGYIKAYWPVYL